MNAHAALTCILIDYVWLETARDGMELPDLWRLIVDIAMYAAFRHMRAVNGKVHRLGARHSPSATH